MSNLVLCPACNKALTVQSASIVCLVCPDCRTIVVKTGASWIKGQKTKAIPEDMTPLQLGAKGNWQGERFEITGRIRSVFGDGYRNLWAMSFDDYSSGWLSEAYGSYAVYRTASYQLPSGKFMEAKAGKKIKFPDDIEYHIDSLDQHLSSRYEGALFELPTGEDRFIIVELSADPNRAALIQVHSKSKIVALVGLFADFNDLQLTDCRDIATWL